MGIPPVHGFLGISEGRDSVRQLIGLGEQSPEYEFADRIGSCVSSPQVFGTELGRIGGLLQGFSVLSRGWHL